MRASQVSAATEQLLDPTSSVWDSVDSQELALAPTPVEYQVTKYVKNAWKDRKWGVVERVTLQAAKASDAFAVRLSWRDTPHPEAEFPDACAVAFPLYDDSPLETFGSREKPLNVWFWRSDSPAEAEDLVARSMRDLARRERQAVRAGSTFEADGSDGSGLWHVVLARELGTNGDDAVSIGSAEGIRLAVLVWEGANEERAGLAAMTPQWVTVEL